MYGWASEQPGVVDGRCPWQGGWNWMVFRASSNPNQCVILCMELDHLMKLGRENPFEH